MFLFILISTPTLNAQIYERGWRVGTSMIYTYEASEKDSKVMINDSLDEEYEYREAAKIRINITEIDELNEGVTMLEHWVDSNPYHSYQNFNASYVSYYLASGFFYFYYYWDSNLNRILLSSFNIYAFDLVPFVHPDWKAFNENLMTVLDGDRIIDTVNTGTVIEYISFSDFISEVSFNINGHTTINESRNSFTADKSRWRFEFDLSNYILDRDYNSYLDIYEYFEYNRYELIYELEYTKGEILSKLSTSKIYSITKKNIRYASEIMYSIKVGDSGTASINYSFVSAIIVLILLPVLLPFKRKKN